ncbi:hypothetical protein EOD39_20844 [Acipenser ruthenus]|uniref:Uncharacterized protein n=1 Tax=Acipenser ruthenus TaxID=7906 RepID=A0A444UUC2_ACIRT|nr:hypothetical protein EOD39_20844 [Acipenser ruthenus]
MHRAPEGAMRTNVLDTCLPSTVRTEYHKHYVHRVLCSTVHSCASSVAVGNTVPTSYCALRAPCVLSPVRTEYVTLCATCTVQHCAFALALYQAPHAEGMLVLLRDDGVGRPYRDGTPTWA